MPEGRLLDFLRAVGIPVDSMPEYVRNVLADLSEDEVNLLIGLQRKMSALTDAGDTEGFGVEDSSTALSPSLTADVGRYIFFGDRRNSMYGTIARIRVKEGAEAKLEQLSREHQALNIPGFVGEYVFRMDADPKECYLIAIFDGKESYRRNAESPEQHQRYEEFRALLEADPEWHDGEVILQLPPR